MLTRRSLLQGLALSSGSAISVSGYAFAESTSMVVTRYRLTPPSWPDGLRLKLALIADLHVCEPWMGVARVEAIVERTNALAPDGVLLLGDYVAGHRLMRFSQPVANADWARALAGLKAPLGVHAVLGNHDWWDDPEVQRNRRGPTAARRALEAAGIPVYENDAVRLDKAGQPFWIAGLGDQAAFIERGRAIGGKQRTSGYTGVHDLPGTLAKVTDDAPVILMAHEPDIFAQMPDRVALTVCGHTHGGQVRLPGFAPLVPSRYGTRYLYGRIVEDGHHMVISSGLGCSALPARFGVPPEIVLVELGTWPAVAQS